MEEPRAEDQRTHARPRRIRPTTNNIYDESKDGSDQSRSFTPALTLPAPPPPPPKRAPRPPTPFNKTVEADEHLNRAALRLYTNFINELSEFAAQQREVTALRLAVQERRKKLHRLREHVSQCDMLLFDCIRKKMSESASSIDPAMLTLFEAAQAARDQVGPVESDYEPLEISLGAEEHKLIDQYTRIEVSFDKIFSFDVASTTRTEEQEQSEIEFESSSGASVERLHGTLIGENVGIGELPRDAGELNLKLKPQIQQKSQGYHTRTASLESVDRPKLRNSISTNRSANANDWMETLSYIGIWATGQIEPSGRNITSRDAPEEDIFLAESIDIDNPDPTSEVIDDLPVNPGLEEGNPLLLLDESEETRAILSDYLVNFENTPDRVNRWMLHQLRVSPHEIYTLVRYIAGVGELSTLWHWATSILNEWPHDSLGHNHADHQGSDEFENDMQNPQRLRYHGACPPGCAFDKSWQVPRSSTFSTPEVFPNLSEQLSQLDTQHIKVPRNSNSGVR